MIILKVRVNQNGPLLQLFMIGVETVPLKKWLITMNLHSRQGVNKSNIYH